MTRDAVGRLTCPICGEPAQDLRVNVNHKLYVYCDNGCAVKLSGAKSKRYLPVLLAGSDVKDDKIGLIISTCKGNKQNEIIKQKEVRNAGNITGANDNNGSTANNAGSMAGNDTGSSAGSSFNGRTNGQYTARRTSASHDSIISRAAAWLADDDEE